MDHQTRTDGGYRLYTEQDLHRLRFIRYAKQLGFTLEAITELLSIGLILNITPAVNQSKLWMIG